MASTDRMFIVAIDPLAAGYDLPRLKELFRSDTLFKA